MKIKFNIATLLLLLQLNFLHAQSNLYFRHFNIKHGLSQNTVSCILQDNSGFIWIGTEDGLNRYNGYDVDVFKHDPSDVRTISHSNIRCLFEDENDVLWIGTDDGLNSYERNTEKFIHYHTDNKNSNSISSNVISGITKNKAAGTHDEQDLLWISTNNGLNSFDVKNNRWTSYKHAEQNKSSLSSNNISCITMDKTGILWIGTNGGGLNEFDIHTKTFTVYKNDPGNEHSISENVITTVYADTSGIVWIGTVNEGLNKFDKATSSFTHFKNNPADENSISQNSIFSLCDDAQGTLWIGTLGGGLNSFNKASGKFDSYKNNVQNISSLSNNSIWSLFNDRAGALWIGTREGVNILDKRMKRFETILPDPAASNNSVYSIYEDERGTIWFGILGGGLVSIEKNGTKKIYHSDPLNSNSLISNNVFSLCEDKEGLLWIGTYDGLNAFDKTTGKYTQYVSSSDNNFSLSDNYIRALLTDRSGLIWIGTYGGGLNSYDKVSEKFKRYKNVLSSNLITCLFQDQSDVIWIGTYGDGLFFYDKDSKTFISFKNESSNDKSLSNNFIHCINQDRAGTLWIGTYGGGLNAFDPKTKTFSRYTERNGLSNNVINGIAPDVNGNLWLSTNKGLCRFMPGSTLKNQNSNVRTYDFQDGAQNKYNEGSFFKSKTGKIFLGGTLGYNAFFPDEIKDNPYLPPVAITRFYLFEKPHSMDTMITSKRSVVLSYKQNFFSFEFAGLNYTYPEKNQYAYMMEGLDKTWNYCNNRRYAAYTNIDPGEYTFRVKASNNDGNWNEQGTFLRITITPPFWKTWWFSIIAGVIVATSILLYIQFRTRTLTKQNIVLEQKVELRTSELKEKNEELVTTMNNLKSTQDQLIHSEKMASLGQLTAGIAHEIQNPLNFVNNFSKVSVELLEELQQAPAQEKPAIAEDLKTNLEKITHHGQRAERIVKGMLMHSRTGSTEKQQVDLNKLVEDSYNLAFTGIRLGDNSFKCEVITNYDARIKSINIIPQDISRVILNLINNAFYAMNEKRKKETGTYQPVLKLSTSLYDNMAIIKIGDNGSGIPKENRDKIFQPFFTTKPTGIGTGLGLSLSYDIITKRHGGEIKLESKEGEGSEFILTLPL